MVALIHQEFGIKRLRFTGGEPLLRHDLADLIAGARDLGITELAMTSNAQTLETRLVSLRRSGLQRINISLDSLDHQTFSRITRGGRLADTLRGIKAAREAGFGPVKLNTVVLRGVNDCELGDLLHFALETDNHIRFLELMPIGEAASRFESEFMSVEEIRERLSTAGHDWEALPWDNAETSRNFRVRDKQGRETVCGFISATSQPFCEGCRRIRLSSDGHLYGCLAQAHKIDLKPLLGLSAPEAKQGMLESMHSAFASKLGTRFKATVASMAEVGG